MSKPPPEDDIARERDEVIKRMIATPPKTHKSEPKRRLTPSPEVRRLPKRRTNKKRDKA
jgi:hypothetical protein